MNCTGFINPLTFTTLPAKLKISRQWIQSWTGHWYRKRGGSVIFWNLNQLHFYHTIVFTLLCFTVIALLCFPFFSFLLFCFIYSFPWQAVLIFLPLCPSSFIVCRSTFTQFFTPFTLSFFLFSFSCCVCGFPFLFLSPLYFFCKTYEIANAQVYYTRQYNTKWTQTDRVNFRSGCHNLWTTNGALPIRQESIYCM